MTKDMNGTTNIANDNKTIFNEYTYIVSEVGIRWTTKHCLELVGGFCSCNIMFTEILTGVLHCNDATPIVRVL